MNKIIKGKRYDTSTAKALGMADNSRLPNDFEYVCKTLFRTKSGNYFLHGEGGGNSRYGEWHGNSGGPGERIIPLDPEDAQEWAEKNLSADEYEKIFGTLREGTVKISADLSESDKARFDQLKKDLNKSAGELISWLMEQAK